MSYLSKAERRNMILHVAKTFVLQNGLQAMTVRRIAEEANISVGQVHHHFKSASHLKAEAFIVLMEELNIHAQALDEHDWYQKIEILLGCHNIQQTQPYLKLWSEAEVLLSKDAEIKRAYNFTMQDWHATVFNMITLGLEQKMYRIHANTTAKDIAWRLIAMVCGFEGMFKLELADLDTLSFDRHIRYMIETELFRPI